MGDGADADAVLALGETVPGLAGEDYPILAEVWSTTLLHENTMEQCLSEGRCEEATAHPKRTKTKKLGRRQRLCCRFPKTWSFPATRVKTGCKEATMQMSQRRLAVRLIMMKNMMMIGQTMDHWGLGGS